MDDLTFTVYPSPKTDKTSDDIIMVVDLVPDRILKSDLERLTSPHPTSDSCATRGWTTLREPLSGRGRKYLRTPLYLVVHRQ